MIVYTRPEDTPQVDWQEFDRGPGYFNISPGHSVRIRLKSIGDEELQTLATELQDLPELYSLDLSENRNLTDSGLRYLKELPQLHELILSSTNITWRGLEHLTGLPHLERLILIYCNHMSDAAVKPLRSLTRLEYLDIQGCLSITRAGINKIDRRGLTIHR